MMLKSLLITGALLLSSSYLSAETVSLNSLLKDMVSRETLTRMPKHSYQAKAATSYDRKSKVNNPEDGKYVEKKGRDWGKGWFANHDFKQFIRLEENNGRKEYVMMEDFGPGALVRFWGIKYNKGNIRIYLDGKQEPVINMPYEQLVGGDGLVGAPFSFKASDEKTNPNWRGFNFYLPIPYAKSCKITLDRLPEYYQFNYNKYDKSVKVRSFTMEEFKESQALIKAVGEKLITGNRKITGKSIRKAPQTLKPKSKLSLKLNKAGAIKKLAIQIDAKDYHQALRSTVIEMNFDGKRTAWLPIGALGGVGYSDEKNDTYFIKVDNTSKTIESYYQMPFRKEATIALKNYGSQDVKIKAFEVITDDYQWSKDSLYFHATWFELRNISTHERSDLNYVTVKGRGRFVGTSITIFNTCTLPNNQTWWGEGDDKFYVDGESFPSIFGTGTEDYFGYAFCRPQRYHFPWISQPRGEGNKKTGYTNNNRYHMIDDTPFKTSLKFDMEIWHPFRKNMNYAAATFYYANLKSSNNSKASAEQVQHKVALTRDDVLNSFPNK